jgi:hypothetical protein
MSKTIKQKLATRLLPPRASRHGKTIIDMERMRPAEFEAAMKNFDPKEEAVRITNLLHAATGPTLMKGKLQGGAEPGWWKDYR